MTQPKSYDQLANVQAQQLEMTPDMRAAFVDALMDVSEQWPGSLSRAGEDPYRRGRFAEYADSRGLRVYGCLDTTGRLLAAASVSYGWASGSRVAEVGYVFNRGKA